jgi:tetratricopeptide (TPR) repeat protein
LHSGEYDKAIADYTEAIRLNPNDAHAFYNRGLARAKKNELNEAIEDYTKAIRLDPSASRYTNRGSVWVRTVQEFH